MVGPGTGVAPMRAFCQTREKQMNDGVKVGPSILFFGCRHEDGDFIYREQFLEWVRGGVLTHLQTAFSRDQQEKIYVQHLMTKMGSMLWDMLNKDGAHIYVCGATLMGADVVAAFKKIAAEHGQLSDADADEYVKDLKAKGRYVAELWET
jgi:NADPH-ferrihemoprotein reductase